jgi:hypothetical protein
MTRPRTRQKPDPIIDARPITFGRYTAKLAARNTGRLIAAAEQLEVRQLTGISLMTAGGLALGFQVFEILSALFSILFFGAIAYVGWRLFRSPSAADRILNEYERHPPRSVYGNAQRRRPSDKPARRSF